MDLKNRTALVTGGATRVGLALSLALARAGCNVVIHYLSSAEEAEAASFQIEALGQRAFALQADLSRAAEVESLLDRVARECPPIDILVNSASVFYRTPLADSTVEGWDDTLNTNLRAPFLLSRNLGLLMAQRGSGKIVNITDCSIHRLYRDFAPYLVSKAGLAALTEVLALELAPNVQVNAIESGTVLLPHNVTKEYQEQAVRRAPLKKIGTPDDIANLLLYLIEHGDFMTGGHYRLDGGAAIR